MNEMHTNSEGQFTPNSNKKFLRFASSANRFSDDESDNYDSNTSFNDSNASFDDSIDDSPMTKAAQRHQCTPYPRRASNKITTFVATPARVGVGGSKKATAFATSSKKAEEVRMTPRVRDVSPVRRGRRGALSMAPATPFPGTPATPALHLTPATPFPHTPGTAEMMMGEDNESKVTQYAFLALMAALFAITSTFVRWGTLHHN
jgi:hypothetical protein